MASLRYMVAVVALLAGVVLLSVAKPVLVPLILATMLAQLLGPLTAKCERFVPVSAAALAALTVVVAALSVLLAIVSSQSGALADNLPEMQHRLAGLFSDFAGSISNAIGVDRKRTAAFIGKAFDSSLTAGGGVAVSAFAVTLSTLAQMALTLVLTFLMLVYRRHTQAQLRRIAERNKWPALTAVIARTAKLAQRYVAGLAIVIVIIGSLDTLGFLLIKAPYPFLFGVCGALAVLVPYVGIILVAPLCLLLTFASTGSAPRTLAVAAVFAVVHFLEGNVVSPYIVGNKVNINPLATIIAVLVGGELWGPIGMLLFIPLTGIARLALDLNPATEPLARLLGTIDTAGRAERRHHWLRGLARRWRETREPKSMTR